MRQNPDQEQQEQESFTCELCGDVCYETEWHEGDDQGVCDYCYTYGGEL